MSVKLFDFARKFAVCKCKDTENYRTCDNIHKHFYEIAHEFPIGLFRL